MPESNISLRAQIYMVYKQEMEHNSERHLKAIFLVVTAHCICISIISRA